MHLENVKLNCFPNSKKLVGFYICRPAAVLYHNSWKIRPGKWGHLFLEENPFPNKAGFDNKVLMPGIETLLATSHSSSPACHCPSPPPHNTPFVRETCIWDTTGRPTVPLSTTTTPVSECSQWNPPQYGVPQLR